MKKYIFYKLSRRERLEYWWNNISLKNRVCLLFAVTVGAPLAVCVLVSVFIVRGIFIILNLFKL